MGGLAKNLEDLLKESGISESELARATGVGQSVINRIISGVTLNPKIETVAALANYFSISLDKLSVAGACIPGRDPRQRGENVGGTKMLPLLDILQVGAWLENRASVTPLDSLMVVTTELVTDAAYVLCVADCALYPRFFEGTYFVVDPSVVPKNRDFLVFYRREQKCAGIRQLFLDNSERYLKALNPDFRIILMRDTDVICGTVLQAWIPHAGLTSPGAIVAAV